MGYERELFLRLFRKYYLFSKFEEVNEILTGLRFYNDLLNVTIIVNKY